MGAPGTVFAISDLHVGYEQNRRFVEGIRPESDEDWLIVAGDVGELSADIEWALTLLRDRFAVVVWSPGNHELWTHPRDPLTLRGVERYRYLVDMCRRIGVLTPEDPYPVWHDSVTIAPLFLLYDYTFRPEGAATKAQALERAYAAGVVCTDEMLLHPDPYPSRDAWCRARLAQTHDRLAALPAGTRTVLVNHFPLIREPTLVLRFPEFAQWCGTVHTADWHRKFNAVTAVYGHLHIPRIIRHDDVPFIEVSLGYPREWEPRSAKPEPRRVLPLAREPVEGFLTGPRT